MLISLYQYSMDFVFTVQSIPRKLPYQERSTVAFPYRGFESLRQYQITEGTRWIPSVIWWTGMDSNHRSL